MAIVERDSVGTIESADARYRQLFEQNVAVQLVVDPANGAIVDANRAAADFYGLSREALTQRAVTELAALPDDDVLQTLEVAAELGAHSFAFPHKHASGELRLVEIYAGPLSMHGRALVHMIVHDVTERVRAEDEARELHAERVAHQRTMALHEELRRQETLSRIGELVAAVAHEVRNPLFAISSTLDAMRSRLGDTPEVQRYYPVLASQVERLNALMRELLDYGKPAALVLEDTEAAGLVQVALDLARPLATAEDVALSTSAVRPLPLIRADRQRVVQVLHNLIVNAVQHSGRGTTVEVVLQPATLRDARAVAFLVRDRGPGFSDGDEARVFEPFFSRRRGGTGMGLALAHRLVHDHGGEIVAANREGGGACLRVVLPAAGDGTRAAT
ncbi:MAG: PAS domain S-box protein [Gemmatimonadaceae bacterium]|jgi:PAS domain S-box-containing protein|nr:PAS domain S-box protein [Gemmatimonadaceae bacterium]MCC7322799.1 PAS domain S-box protein [Gemmatimonadaceae bacterium]HNV75673.1 ATP-binding protein [Gemmatimonadaceae bacterium]HPV73902.1 ATP-binding protein [Gemmatimonadaceae bacterium]